MSNPAVHIAAARDPSTLGGPFVCLSETQISAARELHLQMSERCSALVRFAHDYKELDAKLKNAAKGFCLDEFYTNLPASLTGVLELVYDLNNHPKIKVIEELLYEGIPPARDAREICLHHGSQLERSFFMSTPMLDAQDRLFLQLSFEDERIDELASMRIRPRSATQLGERLGITGATAQKFASFFTLEPPERREPHYRGEDVRVRYFGHACVLIQTAGVSILIDPLTAWERNTTEASLTFADLPDVIDYVIISHMHPDHMVAEMLLQLRARIGTILVPRNDRGNLVDPSGALILKELGFTNIRSVEPFESVSVCDGEVLVLPFLGEHAGLDVMSKYSILVRLKARTFLFLIDSDVVESTLYRRLSRRIGKVDALFIGMECHGAPLTWLYGPLLTTSIGRRDDDSRRLSGSNCARACGVIQELTCERVFVYAMGQEPWLKHIMGLAYRPDSVQLIESDQFIARCRAKGIAAERLSVCREWLF